MKFAAALTALLWLSLIAQVFGDYYIEIAGENPKEAGKSKDAKKRIGVEQPDADFDDTQSCKSNTEGNPSGLTGGLYKCSSTPIPPTNEGKNKEIRCVTAPEKDHRFLRLHKSLKEQAWHGASFFMISGARLRDNQILTFNGNRVEKLPSVMMIGFAQHYPDSPGFLQEDTCTKRNEIATAPVFQPYLPNTKEEVAALTGLFCCNDPLSCYGDERAVEREKIMQSVNIVIDNISKEMKQKDYLRTPISIKLLQQSGSLQKPGSPGRVDSGRKSMKKSESMNDSGGQLKATPSMKNKIKWTSRKWSFSDLWSRSQSGRRSGSQSGSQSGRQSGSQSGRVSGTQSPNNLSRSFSLDSETRDIAVGTEVSAAATLSPGRQNESAEILQREEERQNLHILIKIMLNSVIDPCYILYLKRQGRLSDETKELVNKNCRLHCTLMARAAEIGNGSYGSRGCNRLALYKGNCDDSLKSCLCAVREAKTYQEKLSGGVTKMMNKFVPLKMTYCNNHVRNHLAPISQCT